MHILVGTEARPSEAVRPIPAWPDQNFPYSVRNKSYSVKKTINTIVLNDWSYEIASRSDVAAEVDYDTNNLIDQCSMTLQDGPVYRQL